MENAKHVDLSRYVMTDKRGHEENIIWGSLCGTICYDDKGGGKCFD